jgi:hypothetical protein
MSLTRSGETNRMGNAATDSGHFSVNTLSRERITHPTGSRLGRVADPGADAREDGPKLERDDPQEPRPVDRRANPPAPGRFGPWGSSVPQGTPAAFPSLTRESLVVRPEGRLSLTTTTADCAYPPSSGSPSGPVGPSGRNSNPDFPVQPHRPSGQLLIVGAHEAAVKTTFPLASRVCPASGGLNYFDGI